MGFPILPTPTKNNRGLDSMQTLSFLKNAQLGIHRFACVNIFQALLNRKNSLLSRTSGM